MAKRHLSLPTKLFIAFGVLLFCSLAIILTFLSHTYNRRISEEVYLRIHNGGKTTMNKINSDLSNLELALKDLSKTYKSPKTAKEKNGIKEFCVDRNITYLCWQSFKGKSSANLCGKTEIDYCSIIKPISKEQFKPNYGIDRYNGILTLEARTTSQDENGYWEAGIPLSEDYINKINNLTGMSIILLSEQEKAPIISTLPMAHQPFPNFNSLPKEAVQTLDQFSVYTFQWKAGSIPYQFIFYPLINLSNDLIGTLGVGFSLKAIKTANENAFLLSALFAISLILAFTALGILTAKYFLQPLVNLKKTISNILIRGKNLKVVESTDEVSFLDESFKQIAEELQSSLILLEKAEEAEKKAHRDTLFRLAIAAEYKDEETATHIFRLSRYCEIIAKKMGLPKDEIEILRDASPMHDIGKIGIPDYILQKKGPLTSKEFDIMKTHPEIGSRIFKNAKTPLYETCRIIALTHHEKWDGSGYPRGLKGNEIPLYGRIVAVADVFDALTSVRHYKPAYSIEKSLEIMQNERGTHFDPKILDTFMECVTEIKKTMGLSDHELKTVDIDLKKSI